MCTVVSISFKCYFGFATSLSIHIPNNPRLIVEEITHSEGKFEIQHRYFKLENVTVLFEIAKSVA